MSPKKSAATAKRDPKKSAATATAKRGPGRPIDPDSISRDTPLHFRVGADKKARWEAAAAASAQKLSEWAREGLDAWIDVTHRAGELRANPRSLLAEALENHVRVRAAVAELRDAKALSPTEERLLRILAPAEWARRSDA